MNLRELLDEAAAGLADVEVATGPAGELTWSQAGRPFAAISGDGRDAEFGLGPAIATAAARTPDVVLSRRGPGWVAFRPAVLDDHDADRAAAWFASAHRRLSRG